MSGLVCIQKISNTTESSIHLYHFYIITKRLLFFQDQEVLAAWLHGLHYEEYLSLFVNAGYDLATVARMTPEDLTAIGITKPGHRKRLTLEIHRLNIPDQWPDKKPVSLTF